MNENYRDFISSARTIAAQNDVNWDTPIDEQGNIQPEFIWDLSAMSGAFPSPGMVMKFLRHDKKTRLNWHQKVEGSPALSKDWQDLVKAVVIRKIYINRNKPGTVRNGLMRPIMALAVAAKNKPPWEITSFEVRQTVEVAKSFELSGRLSNNIISVTRSIFDKNRLSDYSPITPRISIENHRRGRKTKDVRRHLSDRKSAEKLPYEDAFWEIIRIIWAESPTTMQDRARFAILKLLVLTGMRISEVSRLPFECIKWIPINHREISGGTPFQARKKALALKHFASKQRSERQDSVTLFESLHHAPEMFNDEIVKTVKMFQAHSEPMRVRLKMQCETGRIFPEYNEKEIVPALDFYTRLTGEPFLYADPQEENLIKSWRKNHDLCILDEIEKRQKKFALKGDLYNRVRQYFIKMRLQLPDGSTERAPFVYSDGSQYKDKRLNYELICFKVGELESFLKRYVPTKLSDVSAHKLRSGKLLLPDELLFLAPKRSMAGKRNGRLCDIRKYAFIGVVQPDDLGVTLNNQYNSLFKRYGRDDEAKNLSIKTHDFRHLQNTELFRFGVSDAIITKRFNRNSVQQSHVYDHRSLAEDLRSIEIPETAKKIMSTKSQDTFRMITAGLAKGPIVNEFKKIQNDLGDEEAYKFLAAEADGIHTTPYGHCINSFTVDPCPKHLECFSGCIHLTRSPLTEHTENLEKVRDRFELLLKTVDDHPAPAAAKEKMKSQAEVRLAGVNKMLETPMGSKVFPDGIDISRPYKNLDRGPFRD